MQIINGPSLQKKATSQWTRDISIIAPRGTIYDSTGSVLAVSYTNYNVYARSREITDKSSTAKILAEKLGLKFTNVFQKISQPGVSEVLLKMQISSELAEEIYNQNLSGIYLAESCGRYYPYGDLLTQVLGFTSSDNLGQTGIEAYFDNLLLGTNGYSFTQSDLRGKEIGGTLRYYVTGQKGQDMTLTINSKIQLILERTLSQMMSEQKAKSTTGIVMKTKTGEIVALSSKPSFDLNNIPRDDLETLFSNSKIKAITDVYEPGSTFKIITLAAALEENLTSLEERFYCGGSSVIDGVKIKCWKSIGHGSQSLCEGFANSCNCVFMSLALRLGVEKFYHYANLFGLGCKTGISLSGEANGILMKKNQVKTVDLARMGFGHAIAVTPIQLLTAVSSILNGGKSVLPSVILNNEKGSTTNSAKQILSEKTSKTMNSLMESATNKTGPFTFVPGYNVGGKTGTAQKYNESGAIAQGKYISSFIGSYPAHDPEYTLIVLVDEPSKGAYYGSIVAAPYGKQVFSEMFNYLGIEKENQTTSLCYVEMPDLVGKALADASEILIKLGINYELDGSAGIVKKQLPPAGTTLAVGDTIVLIT